MAAENCVHAIDHIKKLSEAERARSLLEELARHINPILKARGWKVLKLYEICCCTSGGKNLGVGGFCCPKGDGRTSLRIALRLRTPGHGPSAAEWGAHSLRDFDHCMQILIHEISHIVHGNHSAKFYELMAELQQQYKSLRRTGQVLDAGGMPIVGGFKADGSRHNPASMREARAKALSAAETRARLGGIMGGGGRLNGGTTLGGGPLETGGGSSWRELPPSAMAARAAEVRHRAWDEANGLEKDELTAAAQALDESDADDEVTEVVPYAAAAASRPAASTQGSNGRLAAEQPRAPQVSWGAAGAGVWQKVDCPVCGPVCNASLHDPAGLPPQDADEGAAVAAGARGSEPGVGMSSRDLPSGRGDRPAGSGTGCADGEASRRRPPRASGGGGVQPSGTSTSVVVDLTGSDDEPDHAAGAAAAAGWGATKRARGPPTLDATTASAGPTAREWRCARCTFAHNALSSVACEMECGEPRPQLPGEWTCMHCTCRNQKADTHCGSCANWRYSRPIS